MTQTDQALEQIIANFYTSPSCEETTLAGGRCRRPARWRIDLHGCEEAIMCGHHKNAWTRSGGYGARLRCAHCGRVFASIDAAVRITAI